MRGPLFLLEEDQMNLKLNCATCGSVTSIESTEECDCKVYQEERTWRRLYMWGAITIMFGISVLGSCCIVSEYAEVDKFRDAVELGATVEIEKDGRAVTPDTVIHANDPKPK